MLIMLEHFLEGRFSLNKNNDLRRGTDDFISIRV